MQRIHTEVESGSIVQANENAGDWCGCLLIVDEIKAAIVIERSDD